MFHPVGEAEKKPSELRTVPAYSLELPENTVGSSKVRHVIRTGSLRLTVGDTETIKK